MIAPLPDDRQPIAERGDEVRAPGPERDHRRIGVELTIGERDPRLAIHRAKGADLLPKQGSPFGREPVREPAAHLPRVGHRGDVREPDRPFEHGPQVRLELPEPLAVEDPEPHPVAVPEGA